MSKRCNKCLNLFTLDCFYKDRNKSDGLHTICKDCAKKNVKIYRINNPDKLREYETNRREQKKINLKTSRENIKLKDPKLYDLRRKHRYINFCIRTGKDCEYIGIPIVQYYRWLELNFDKHMNWDNYGSYWEIDHTIPYYVLDESEGFHWSNTFPMAKLKNLTKSNKIDVNLCKERQDQVNFFKYLEEIK